MLRFHRCVILVVVTLVGVLPAFSQAQNSLDELQRLAALDIKPFVVVEAAVDNTASRSQGVVIGPQGLVLSVGHVSFVAPDKGFAENFRVSLRGPAMGMPAGFGHVHKTIFADREGAEFLEFFYAAELIKANGSRFVAQADLALFRIKARSELPTIDFFAEREPILELGETLYLCHYNFPHQPADPIFLISPIKVAGVVQTSSGFQFLGEGYYRLGSSGGAILKNGRLIGIQSAAYTTNAKEGGEIPLGLVSFQLVWKDMFQQVLANDSEAAESKPAGNTDPTQPPIPSPPDR